MPFQDALTDLNAILSPQDAKTTPAPTLPPAPTPGFAQALSDLTTAGQSKPTTQSTLLPQGQQPFATSNPITAMGMGLIDALAAGAQGVSPKVGAGYQLAPQAEQDFFAEMGHPRDTTQMAALRDPGTGKYAVYLKQPGMEESGAASLGRVLSYGAVPEAGIPAAAAAAAPTASQALLQDFTRVGVPPSMPAVGQGIASRLTANVVSKIPFFGGPVQEATGKAIAGTGAAAERLAGGLGEAKNAEEAGRAIQGGVEGFARGPAPAGMTANEVIAAPTSASSFQAKSGALYDRFWSQIDPTANVPVSNTLEALKGPLERFPSSPELGAQITNPKLQAYFRTLAPGEKEIPAVYSSIVDQSGNPILMQAAQKMQTGGTLTVGELQELRSTIGRQLSEPMLVNDIPRADLKRVYAAMSDDLAGAAKAAGPDVQQAFNRANQYYSAGMKRIDQLEPLLSGSPEQTFAAINRAASTGTGADAGLLRSLQRSMSPDEWGNVGSAVIRRMGEPTAGVKSPHGGDFSASSFVTNWNKLSDSAKETLFGANVPGSSREGLESLVRVADAQKQLSKLANPSGTGSHTIGALMVGAVAEHFTSLISHPLEAALAALGGYGASKALMSPGFARWLYAMPRVMAESPGRAAGLSQGIAALSQMARIDPSLAGVAQRLQGAYGVPAP